MKNRMTWNPECSEWDQGWKIQFIQNCNMNNWTYNNNPCNCHEFIECKYTGPWEPQTCGGNIFNPCKGDCLPAPITCPEMMDACNCDPLEYENDLHCPWKATTTTTTTTSSWISSTSIPDSEDGNLLWLWILLTIVATSLLILVVVFILWRKRKWGKVPDRHQAPWHLSVFVFLCLPFTTVKSSFRRERNNRKDGGFSSNPRSRPSGGLTPKPIPRPSLAPYLASTSSQRQRYRSLALKYKFTNIFPVDLLDIGSTLGKGAYGKVFIGRLRVGPDLRVEVAVKTSTRSSGAEDMERERKVFAKLKLRQLNIVNLMGVCLPTEEDFHPMLLLELCEGNLEKHLHKNKDRFIDYGNKDTKMLMDTGEFTSTNLLKYCYQISRGMEFLEQHKIVHGDLATRNILLSQRGTVAKVSDFGLSMSLYTSTEELKSGSSGLPVRWMAPEVLQNRQVSNKSDTWSFGVLLWEVFSLGAVPYPEIAQIDHQFIQDLSDGVRKLGKPLYKVPMVQNPLDKIRLTALELQEQERPSFGELSSRMWQVLEDASRDDYAKLEKEYDNYIQLYTTSYEMLHGAERDHVRQNHQGMDKSLGTQAVGT